MLWALTKRRRRLQGRTDYNLQLLAASASEVFLLCCKFTHCHIQEENKINSLSIDMFLTITSSVKTYLLLVCYCYWIIYLPLLRITESIYRSHVYIFDMLYISFPVTWEMNINN
jgi:hypothetical protein